MSTPDNIVSPNFGGFDAPKSNYCKFPLQIIDELPNITTISEMKVMLYILRHTWGYQEFDEGKKITLDEFEKGRKRRDGTRIDRGTGLTIPSIRSGIKAAVKHGYISVETDDSDPARVKNYYALSMKSIAKQSEIQGEKDLHPEGKEFTPRVKESLPRTEKDTKDKIPKKETISATQSEPKPDEQKKDTSSNEWYDVVKEVFDLHGGRNGNMQKMLQGNATDRAHKPYNLDVPMTVPELRLWSAYYRSTVLDGSTTLSMVKSPEKIQSSIIGWREKKQVPQVDRRLEARKLPANIAMLNTTGEQSA